tara:strand:- start:433 stop:939 length:507 start_codon:yes stop_codon:yes gene_type:complete
MINFQRAFKFGRPFFERVARKVLNLHKRNIFDFGQNSSGKTFESYAPYRKAYKRRKVAGKAAPKGKTQISRSATPNLTLTGEMKKSFSYVKSSAHGFEYGISDPRMAERMEFQGPKKKSGRKRLVSTKTNPTNPMSQELIKQEMLNQILLNFTKEIRKNGMGYKVYTI